MMGYSELPSSTFLPYLVHFLKENTAVCFFLQKSFLFFLLFLILESESTEIYTHYVMKTCSEFFNNNVQK